jgi:hypothetical protein
MPFRQTLGSETASAVESWISWAFPHGAGSGVDQCTRNRDTRQKRGRRCSLLDVHNYRLRLEISAPSFNHVPFQTLFSLVRLKYQLSISINAWTPAKDVYNPLRHYLCKPILGDSALVIMQRDGGSC